MAFSSGILIGYPRTGLRLDSDWRKCKLIYVMRTGSVISISGVEMVPDLLEWKQHCSYNVFEQLCVECFCHGEEADPGF